MDNTERYYYRRDHHLCTKCGEELPPEQTLKMCDICRRFTHAKQNARYAEKDAAWKAKRSEYGRKWRAEHPERIKIYNERRKDGEKNEADN